MYKIIPTERFERDVKYYIKKKGFRHIAKDIKSIMDELEIYYKKEDSKILTNQEIIDLVETYCISPNNESSEIVLRDI